jgi:hypothetical protein
MKNKVAIGVVAGVAAIVFLPITKIVIGAAICTGAYYGYKELTK